MVNKFKCKRCGNCCTSFSIVYEKSIKKVNPSMFSEILRFNMLKTNKIIVKEFNKYFEVTFNIPCKHLSRKSNIYYCNIHDSKERPLMCKEFPYKNTNKEDCKAKVIK